MSKIIGVGMHKTGTTSLGKALKILGYSWSGWREESASLFKRGHQGALIDMVEDFDCFEDSPWYLMYEDIWKRYPDVKLILTKRKSLDDWYDSLVKHLGRRGESKFSFLEILYGTENIADCRDHVLDRHLRHISSVREFSKKYDVPLLEVCWEDGDGWAELCEFLGKPIPQVAFPRANAAAAKGGRLSRKLYNLGLRR